MKSISAACVLDTCVITASSDSLIKVWEISIGNENGTGHHTVCSQVLRLLYRRNH